MIDVNLALLDQLTEKDIREVLLAEPHPPHLPAVDFGLRFPPDTRLRTAAVLIPFLRVDGHWEILFTRRTDLVQDHKGQVAFPGGGVETIDRTPAETALRETQEEIGLDPGLVNILGYLEPMLSRGGFRINPVVGSIPWPFPIIASENEVSRVFTIPLTWLADPANYEERRITDGEVVRNIPVVFYREFDGETLWGISGRITVSRMERLVSLIQK